MRTRRHGIPGLAGLAGLVLALAPTNALGLAGGATGSSGGSSSGGSSGGSGGSGGSGEITGIWWIDLLIVLAVLLVVFGGGAVATWWTMRRRRQRVEAVERAATIAGLGDDYWHPRDLRARVEEAFLPVQLSWERRDVTASRPFVSDALYERHRLQLEGYEAQNRVNRIEDLKLGRVDLVRLFNVEDDGADRFVARIECSARDWMEDTTTGAVVNGNRGQVTQFVQYWSFARHPEHGWVLDEIQQGTEGDYHLEAPLVNTDADPAATEPPPPPPPPPVGSPPAGAR